MTNPVVADLLAMMLYLLRLEAEGQAEGHISRASFVQPFRVKR